MIKKRKLTLVTLLKLLFFMAMLFSCGFLLIQPYESLGQPIVGVGLGIYSIFSIIKTITLLLSLYKDNIIVTEVNVKKLGYPKKSTVTVYTDSTRYPSQNISKELGVKAEVDGKLVLIEWSKFHSLIAFDYLEV